MSARAFLDRHQVAFCLAAIGFGAVLGLAAPVVAHPAEILITPVLALLLYATFLGVPFGRLGRSLRDGRFLATVLAVNVVAVPAVVWLVTRPIADQQPLLIGALLVLLTPCVDYVVAFTGLAGGAKDRLLAATPLLMIGQMLTLPLFLGWFAGPSFAAELDLRPFIEAFIWLIVVPLGAAGVTQAIGRTRGGRLLRSAGETGMVPLMMLTLATVVASQVGAVGARLGELAALIPLYLGFAVLLVAVGLVAGRWAGLDVAGRRAVVFSGVTRNSLVVLPLALALPPAFAITPLAVVTQTLVELVLMVVLVRVVPMLVRTRA
ncbi:arsenic resistance protein [Leucobacter rhizosphaerae]|uniref:Arsenic resistance protein n=1 Tax=Leucobacter rhizosphaerae TaxID=2932245 RepID=A0ABY4FY57_9MICO|nr:arsenic resistance protein [Leucobacter rhizosphaerae]UOQ61193.1 arsenic resistance protein [Leucobacter rhizosphaerae]